MQHARLDGDDDAVEDDADQGEQDDGDEHLGGVARTFGKGQQIAQSGVAADQLTHQHADDRQSGRDAKTGEQRRHGGGKLDLPEDLQAVGGEGLGQPYDVGIERPHRAQDVDHDGEEHDQHADQDLRVNGVAEPDDEE